MFLICAEVILNVTKFSHRFTSLDSAVFSAISQRTKEGLPCEFASSGRIFLVRSTFLKFFIDNFWNYSIVQYGHIWYQNDGNKISDRIMRSNFKNF